MNNKYLFLFTIGPVQSYIQQSRKTRDLFASSRILSLLSSCAMKAILERNEHNEIIFPYFEVEETAPSYPNRCIALVEESNISVMGEDIEQIVRNKYEEMARQYIGEEANAVVLREHLQVFWVFTEYKDDYESAYKNLEEAMGMVKSLRIFKQDNNAEYEIRLKQDKRRIRKCNLCGERLVTQYNSSKNYKSNYKLTSYEGLCDICLLKRMYQSEKREEEFLSTSSIALAYWKRDMAQNTSFSKYYERIQDILKEEFSDEILYGNSISFDSTHLQYGELKNLLAKIRDEQKNIGTLKRRYYALLVFDGDNMGKWVSGEFFQQKYREDGTGQKKVSQLLGQYAKWTKTYLNMNQEELGSVVYAGGDDFMGFIPLDHLFTVVQTLREKFEEMVNGPLCELKEDPNKNISFSAGICIAHYKTPLDKVISEARKQEEIAKRNRSIIYSNEVDKDSFSISVLKRSGEHILSTLSFRTRKSENAVLNILSAIMEKMESFSDNFIRVLDKEWSGMEQVHKATGRESFLNCKKNMILSETKRVLARSCLVEPDKAKEVIEDLYDKIKEFYETCCVQDTSFQNFISMLYIIEFLGRELNDN